MPSRPRGLRARRPAGLAQALLVMLVAGLLTACSGVPEAGPVTRVAPVSAPDPDADLVQQKPPPLPVNVTPQEFVTDFLLAMSVGDLSVMKGYLAPSYAPEWIAQEPSQTTVFKSYLKPQSINGKTSNKLQVTFTAVGVIDASNGYRRSTAPTSAIYTLEQLPKGRFLISNINVPGLFVSSLSLPALRLPVHLYFPSQRSHPPGALPRLVPDTAFMSAPPNPNTVISQLLNGPTTWTVPGVYVVPNSAQITVSSVQTDPASGLTTVNLSAAALALTPVDLATLKAQIAYTLADLGTTGSLQLEEMNHALGGPYSLSQLSAGYNPDGAAASSPLFYVSNAGALLGATPSASSQGPDAPDNTVTKLAHVDGVQQIAVEPAGVGEQAVVGVRQHDGKATLQTAVIGDSSAHPWATITVPGAVALSTPSFDHDGSAVWTVATTANGATQLYRVPIGADRDPPEPVRLTDDQGAAVRHVTAFRLAPDGSRAALIAGGQASVGIVHQSSATTSPYTVVGVRPVITVDDGSTDTSVLWSDRFNVGVVVQQLDVHKVPIPGQSTLVTVSADGYAGATGDSDDGLPVPNAPTGTDQFAHAPSQLWVASKNGQLSRQPALTPGGTDVDAGTRPWIPLGPGTWPTYAG